MARREKGSILMDTTTRTNRARTFIERAFLALFIARVACAAPARLATRQSTKESSIREVKGIRITAVEGESWLRHLGVPFIVSSMGRVANWGEAPPSAPIQLLSGERPDGDFVLSGADLYRLNCRSCHKA